MDETSEDEPVETVGRIEIAPAFTTSEVESLMLGVEDGACWEPSADGRQLRLISDAVGEAVLELRASIHGLFGPRGAARRQRRHEQDFAVGRRLNGFVVCQDYVTGDVLAIRVTSNRVTSRVLWSGGAPVGVAQAPPPRLPDPNPGQTATIIDLSAHRARA